MRARGYAPLTRGGGRRAAENARLADELRREDARNRSELRRRASIDAERETLARLERDARALHLRRWDPDSAEKRRRAFDDALDVADAATPPPPSGGCWPPPPPPPRDRGGAP